MSEAIQKAREVFAELCAAIDARDWHYEKDEDNLSVRFGVTGADLPMKFMIAVDAKRQVVRLLSPFTSVFPEDRRVEGAVAACAMTYPLANGSFDFDVQSGTCWFRQTASFRESKIGGGLLQNMISYTCAAVDLYNDRIDALVKGELSLREFLESIGKR